MSDQLMRMDEKPQYEELITVVDSVLDGEVNIVSVMSTLACLLKHHFNKIYWVGFYIEDKGTLKVGPYQGTLACLQIEPDRGLCGRAFRTGETQIVNDVHADPGHITCDAASLSEIVIPVKQSNGTVYGVLDVDSDRLEAFGDTDRKFLELTVSRRIEVLF